MAGVCARARVWAAWGYLGVRFPLLAQDPVAWRTSRRLACAKTLHGQVFFDVFAVHLGLVALGDDFAS